MKPSETTSSSSSSLQTSSPTGTMGIRPEPKYKGVRKRKWGKWVSEIRLPNSRERIWLGSYDSAEKAARAFDAALYCLRGRGATFNFPESPPEIEGGESLGPQEIQAVAGRYANEEPGRREITRGIMEEETSLSAGGGGTQIERSSNDEGGAIDWSFLNMLESGSDFGLHHSGLHNVATDHRGDDYYAPPLLPHSPQILDTNLDDASQHLPPYSQHDSFLWNF